MNMTLDGLEHAAKKSVPYYFKGTSNRTGVTVIRYADDFIVSAKTRDLLEANVLPALKIFLAHRGLALSEKKTKITHINEGFDFLGQNVRKYSNDMVLTTPTRKSLQGLQAAARRILKAQCVMDNWSMIRRLNQLIRGWCNYHRHACSSRTFNKFDSWLFFEIKRWLHRRHPNKGRQWLRKKYYRSYRNIQWSFYAVKMCADGRKEYRDLLKAGWTHIVRHIKVRREANPYDPSFIDYFISRKQKRMYINQDGRFVEETG
jgi:RNA-directed DNA polymerase